MSELTRDEVTNWRGNPVTQAYFKLVKDIVKDYRVSIGSSMAGETMEKIALNRTYHVGFADGISSSANIFFDIEAVENEKDEKGGENE